MRGKTAWKRWLEGHDAAALSTLERRYAYLGDDLAEALAAYTGRRPGEFARFARSRSLAPPEPTGPPMATAILSPELEPRFPRLDRLYLPPPPAAMEPEPHIAAAPNIIPVSEVAAGAHDPVNAPPIPASTSLRVEGDDVPPLLSPVASVPVEPSELGERTATAPVRSDDFLPHPGASLAEATGPLPVEWAMPFPLDLPAPPRYPISLVAPRRSYRPTAVSRRSVTLSHTGPEACWPCIA